MAQACRLLRVSDVDVWVRDSAQLVQDLFDQIVNRARIGLQPKLGVLVASSTSVPQRQHRRPVGGQGSAAVGREALRYRCKGHVKPDGGAVTIDSGLVRWVDEGSAPRGDDEASLWEEFLKDTALELTKVTLRRRSQTLQQSNVARVSR